MAEAGGGHPRTGGCSTEHWFPRHVAVGPESGEEWGNHCLPPSLKGRTVRTHVPRLRFCSSADNTWSVGTGGEKRAVKKRATFDTVLEGDSRRLRDYSEGHTHNTHNTLSHCHTVGTDLPHSHGPPSSTRREAPEGHHILYDPVLQVQARGVATTHSGWHSFHFEGEAGDTTHKHSDTALRPKTLRYQTYLLRCSSQPSLHSCNYLKMKDVSILYNVYLFPLTFYTFHIQHFTFTFKHSPPTSGTSSGTRPLSFIRPSPLRITLRRRNPHGNQGLCLFTAMNRERRGRASSNDRRSPQGAWSGVRP